MGKIIRWIFGRKANQAFLAVIGFLLFSLPVSGQVVQSNTEYAKDRVIIKFADQNAQQNFLRTKSRIQTFQIRELSRSGPALMNLNDMTVQEAVEQYRNDPNVEYVEPDYKVYAIEPVMSTNVFPTDSLFNHLWGLHNTGQTGGTEDADIDAPEAWDKTSQNENEIIVGVIDTGVDYNHIDLTNNMWINSGETPGNGEDDDGNGYVDDYYGYDFFNNNGDPMDNDGHGTHVAGTIAAERGNNTGITGVSHKVKIMALKFLGPEGGSTSDAIEAIGYATNNGAHLTNNSWGGGGFSQALKDAISAAGDANQLFMAAAGNEGLDNEVNPHYPSSYDLGNIISVAATNHNDGLSEFSNYGETSVDLGAPGSSIVSTLPNNDYGSFSGTSMATPHVSGVAALIWSEYPELTQQEVRTRILNSIDRLPSLDGATVTGGRLNANNALENDETPPDEITDLTVSSVSNNSVDLDWTATGDDGSTGTATAYDIRYSTLEITDLNFDAATQVPNNLIPDSTGTLETFTISGLDFNTSYFFAVKAIDNRGNQSGVSNSPSATTPPPPVLGFSPESFSEILHIGNTNAQTLIIENTGTADLEFSFPGMTATEILNNPNIKKNEQKKVEYRKLAKKEEDNRSGAPVVLGAGGPDEFGYKWIDSDETGGPAFQWEDISPTGTVSTIDNDDDYQFVDIGFSFGFYGESYNQAMIGENGMLTFTNYNFSEWTNQPIPDSNVPNNMIAPYWDDHFIPEGGSIYYETKGTSPNRRFIVQWQSVPHISDTSSVFTYQLILSENTNNIKFQYLEMTGGLGDGNSATVGIENLDGSDGLQTSFNTSYVHDSLAVSISAPPPWLSVSSTSGTVTSESSQNIDVIFDATNMTAGDFSHRMVLNSNDPNNPEPDIPIDLHVDGTPDIGFSTSNLDLGLVYLGYEAERAIEISNTGTDSLEITDITSGNTDFTPDTTSFSLNPNQSQNVTITYNPTEVGAANTELTINSNDPDQSSVTIGLSGESIEPPIASVNPDSIGSNLKADESEVHTLTIANSDGGSALEFLIQKKLYNQDPSFEEQRFVDDSFSKEGNNQKIESDFEPNNEPNNNAVLVIQNTLAWGVDLVNFINQNFDVTASQISSDEISSINFSQFELIITAGDQPSTYYSDISSNVTKFENFLNSGGTVQYQTATQGPDVDLAGGVTSKYGEEEVFNIVEDGVHPIVSDLPDTLEGNWANHNTMQDFPESTNIITRTANTGSPTTIEYNYGQGRVIATGMTWEFLYFFGYNSGPLMYNAINYTLGNTLDWIIFSNEADTVEAGNTMEIEVTIDATNKIGGEYLAQLDVLSNDPANESIRVPVGLTVESKVVSIELTEGWNLKSFNVQPEQDSTHKVLDGVVDNLNVALGFSNGKGQTFDPSLPDFNSLKTMDSHHGYWLKMDSNDLLNIDGTVSDPQTSLQLQQGYNLVSYLPENPDSLTHALSDIMDKIDVVLGFDGSGMTFDPSVPIEMNSLQILEPKNGYWIKLSESAELVYPTNQIAEEEEPPLAKSKEEEVSSPVKPTREWITVWGKELRMDGEPVPAGTVVQAIDSDGVVSGQAVIEEAGKLKMLSIYRDDPETEVDEGAQSNEQITLSLGNHTIENAVVWSNQGDVKNISGQNAQPSSSAIPDEYALKQNYPNPFNPTTTIRYALPEQSEVSIRVYNILGRLVSTLVQDQEMEPGKYKVTFDGSRLASGMYFYRIKAGDFVETKKLLLIK